MTSRNQHSTTSFYASITEAARIERIVDYAFEKSEKSNVLAIHPTRPLIAYLICIQRAQKISKAWGSGNESAQSPSSSINGQLNQTNPDKNKTISIRIIDYVTRQRCLAKGIYHARPADCVFTTNSITCVQADVIKLAVVDRVANIYLYDLSYFINDLIATRIAVIRGPGQDVSPYEFISLVWCPYVPCEDFDDGEDGGLRLALATNTKIEIFAVDRLQGKAGELQRSQLSRAYKCIQDAHKTNIVSLSISPDCSTISAAALDNRVTFFSSDLDDNGQRCLHNWEANVTDKSSISKLFFLDDYPKLLEDSTLKFWGAAFIGTKSGQMLLVDLRTWTVYQRMNISTDTNEPKNFSYRIDLTSRIVVAINGNQCFIVQIEHNHAAMSSKPITATVAETNLFSGNNTDLMNGNIFNYLSNKQNATTPKSNQNSASKKPNNPKDSSLNGLPRIVRTTRLGVHNPIYSFVIKLRSDDELELFTITAFSLERYTINLSAISGDAVEDISMSASLDDSKLGANTPHELKRFLEQFDGSLRISSSGATLNNTPNNNDVRPTTTITPAKQELDVFNLMNASAAIQSVNKATATVVSDTPTGSKKASADMSSSNLSKNGLDVAQMDRMVEALFTKLNTAFSQGLEEFLSDVKCEVNDLKLKLNGLCRDVRKLQQQLQEARQK